MVLLFLKSRERCMMRIDTKVYEPNAKQAVLY